MRTGPVRLAIGIIMAFGVFCVVLPLAGKRGNSSSALRVTPGHVGGLTELAEEVSQDKAHPSMKHEVMKNSKKQDGSARHLVSPTPAPPPPPSFSEEWPCNDGEELFFGVCYIKCDTATEGKFKFRVDECTCAASRPANRANPEEYTTDCVNLNMAGNGNKTHQPFLTDCPYKDEELYEGLCYTKCNELTYGQYPIRTGMNTCSNGKYGGDWTMGFGVCSGFAIGNGACLPNIPKAEGSGFPGPAAEKGEAPMGFKTVPVPNRVSNPQVSR